LLQAHPEYIMKAYEMQVLVLCSFCFAYVEDLVFVIVHHCKICSYGN